MPALSHLFGAFWPNVHAVAAHEVAHGLLASHVGLNVHKVELVGGGRAGVTSISGKVQPKDELLVAVAGFVGEEFALGHTGITGFTKGQYSQDFAVARELVGDDVVAIQAAITQVQAYLTRPEVQAYAEYLAGVLEHKGIVDGALIKAP